MKHMRSVDRVMTDTNVSPPVYGQNMLAVYVAVVAAEPCRGKVWYVWELDYCRRFGVPRRYLVPKTPN